MLNTCDVVLPCVCARVSPDPWFSTGVTLQARCVVAAQRAVRPVGGTPLTVWAVTNLSSCTSTSVWRSVLQRTPSGTGSANAAPRPVRSAAHSASAQVLRHNAKQSPAVGAPSVLNLSVVLFRLRGYYLQVGCYCQSRSPSAFPWWRIQCWLCPLFAVHCLLSDQFLLLHKLNVSPHKTQTLILFCRCFKSRQHSGWSLVTAICKWMQIN